MIKAYLKKTLSPPAGRPNWRSQTELPLIYLGWGQRDFFKHPLDIHCDFGTNYYFLVRGKIKLHVSGQTKTLKGPTLCLFDPDCPFGITQELTDPVEILVWIWQGAPLDKQLSLHSGGFSIRPLQKIMLPPFTLLHERCRNEVALADHYTSASLHALHHLLDIEIARISQKKKSKQDDICWQLANSWISSNLAIHAPIPALCDYLRMSPQTLHRFFKSKCGVSPGKYFRNKKVVEARRLISEHGWQVKRVAYHLGYRHSNDLSRFLCHK